MKPLSVVVAQNSGKASDILSKSLNNHFRVVTTATGMNELLIAIPFNVLTQPLLILELVGLKEVQQLRNRFPPLPLSVPTGCRMKRCGHRRFRPALPIAAIALTCARLSRLPAAYGPCHALTRHNFFESPG